MDVVDRLNLLQENSGMNQKILLELLVLVSLFLRYGTKEMQNRD